MVGEGYGRKWHKAHGYRLGMFGHTDMSRLSSLSNVTVWCGTHVHGARAPSAK